MHAASNLRQLCRQSGNPPNNLCVRRTRTHPKLGPRLAYVPRPEPFDYPVRGFAPLPFARSIAAGQAQSIRVKDRESGESSGPKRETRPAVRSQLVTGLWRMSGRPAIQQALGDDYFESLGLPRIYVPAPA